MKNIIICTLLIFCVSHSFAQKKIESYEYWFDNGYVDKTAVSVAPIVNLSLNSTISTTGLTDGIHTFNIRFKDDSGLGSNTLSQFFYKIPASFSIERKLIHYEYWFDRDYANKAQISVTPAGDFNLSSAIPTTGLTDGIHTLSIRFKDVSGFESAILSHFFYKIPENNISSENKIVAYRYWFNNDFDKVINVSLSAYGTLLNLASDIDIMQIPVGQNTMHFQFRDVLGMWSSVTSDIFDRTITTNIIENLFKNRIVVYPNPTNGSISVDIGESLDYINVSIHNINGKLVQQFVYKGRQTFEFNLSEPAGIYVMNISSGKKRATIRLIKN